jgi:hypothetical protein
MHWSDIPWTPSSKTLRHFAGLWSLVFAGLACWHGWMSDRPVVGAVFAGLGCTVGPLGLVVPAAIRPLFVGWMILAFPVGWVVSNSVLAILFYGVFTPVGLVFKLIGRDVLCRRYRHNRATYWTAKPTATNLRSYFRQY